MGKAIRVLIVDDSALVRKTLTEIIDQDPQLEVMAVAADPYFAARHILSEVPDVITLDIEMPRMDGISFLKRLMARHPVPVVVISSLTQNGSDLALKALDLGATEIVAKSEIRNTREHLNETRIRITGCHQGGIHDTGTPFTKNATSITREATASKGCHNRSKSFLVLPHNGQGNRSWCIHWWYGGTALFPWGNTC